MSDLIITIPADEYLNQRRRVEAFTESPLRVDSEFTHPESATVNVVEGFPAFLRRAGYDRPTTVAVMLSGHTYDDETNTPVAQTAHAGFTPEQAEALAHALIIAAAEAREVEASIVAPLVITRTEKAAA